MFNYFSEEITVKFQTGTVVKFFFSKGGAVVAEWSYALLSGGKINEKIKKIPGSNPSPSKLKKVFFSPDSNSE